MSNTMKNKPAKFAQATTRDWNFLVGWGIWKTNKLKEMYET